MGTNGNVDDHFVREQNFGIFVLPNKPDSCGMPALRALRCLRVSHRRWAGGNT